MSVARKLRHGLAALLLLISPAIAQTVSDLDGDWDGTIVPLSLRLTLHVESKDGSTNATLISIDQGNARLPVSALVRAGNDVSFEFLAGKGRFSGTLQGDTLSGVLSQGEALPLVLTRRVAGAAAPAPRRRPQEPQPPLPYAVEEVTVAGPDGTLAGTLTLPQSPAPVAAVLLVAGSGPTDRDESIAGHKPFLVLADALTRRGIAVLRMDKRGVGKSTGNYAAATSKDFAQDAQAAITYLRTRKEVDARKVGLLGHSEGGLVAPMVAARDPAIAFVVLMAAPGLTGEDILTRQQRIIAAAGGATPNQLDKAEATNRALYRALANAQDDGQMRSHALPLLQAAGIPAAQQEAALKEIGGPWFRYFLSYDPEPMLRQVSIPVLAITGDKDTQVTAPENLAVIRAALSGNPDTTVLELPGLNHLFQSAKTGLRAEYNEIEETMSPAALAIIGDWIVQRTR